MEQQIRDIESGKELYLTSVKRYEHATIRKVGSCMGFPVYVVEEYMHGIRSRSYVYDDLQKALAALKKLCYTFVKKS